MGVSPIAVSPIARLQGCARVLGLEPKKDSYGLRPSTVLARSSEGPATLADCVAGDLMLLILEYLQDKDKVSLACITRSMRAEQRRMRPTTSFRMHVSLSRLVNAGRAGWRVAKVHVDKRSGAWITSGQEDDVLAEIESLSIIGRPDCALLVLSPFTDLSAMRQLRTFELDSCAIGNAGVGVLAAAIRNGAMPSLGVLDLRRNQIGDGGALSLAAAFSHASDGSMLPRLTTLGLDQNLIGEFGLVALADAIKGGALYSLRHIFVDLPRHESLSAACAARSIELSSW